MVLSLLAGVRTEEVRAITWDEVDLTAGTVAVYRSVRIKGDTKTRKSRRVLKLPTGAVQALRAHHTRQAAERLAAGEMWQEHDLVFCREDGTPLDRWHVRKEFQKITKAARLGGEWTPRELRHSFVSILSGHDARLEDISDLVGHSSTSVSRGDWRAVHPDAAHHLVLDLHRRIAGVEEVRGKERLVGDLPGMRVQAPRLARCGHLRVFRWSWRAMPPPSPYSRKDNFAHSERGCRHDTPQKAHKGQGDNQIPTARSHRLNSIARKAWRNPLDGHGVILLTADFLAPRGGTDDCSHGEST